MNDAIWTGWVVYLLAAGVFTALLWRFTAGSRPGLMRYLVRAFFIALIYTPWYANPSGESFAPALMVATLDLITSDAETAMRPLVPLVTALMAAMLIAMLVYFLKSKAFKKQLGR